MEKSGGWENESETDLTVWVLASGRSPVNAYSIPAKRPFKYSSSLVRLLRAGVSRHNGHEAASD